MLPTASQRTKGKRGRKKAGVAEEQRKEILPESVCPAPSFKQCCLELEYISFKNKEISNQKAQPKV